MDEEVNDAITPTHFIGSDGTDPTSNVGRFSIATAAGLFASNFQPLDSDLTSWALVTRASGFDTFAATPSSANLRALLTDEVGTGAAYFVGGALGTPASGDLENCTGYLYESLVGIPLTFPPAAHDHPWDQITETPTTLSGYGITDAQGLDADLTSWAAVTRASGFDAFVATPSSANLRALLTDEEGTGAVYFVGGALGTPASGTLTNCTGYPYSALVSPPTLGSIASQNSNSVAITGGSISGITDLAIADGGTGQSTAQNAINALTQVSAATNEHVLTKDTATGNATWKAAAGGGGTVIVDIQQFRLTTESGVSVSSSDRTAQSTIYLTPHIGNQIALYDGSAWQLQSSAEVSLALSGLTSARNYDVFAYWSGSAVVLELSTVWTNDTTRADAIVRQDGVWCKSGALTRRLVGTIRTTATTTTEDSELRRLVWNVNNQFRRRLFFDAGSSSHTYASSTVRQYNGSSAAQVDFVRGLATGSDIINTTVQCTTGGTTSNPGFGVGVNSTSSLLTGSVSNISGVSMTGRIGAPAVFNAQVGYNYLALLQANFTGAGSPTFDLGRMLGEVLC